MPLNAKLYYLQRRVLFCFIIIFIILIATIEGLVAFSQKNNGIGAANKTQHYLWTYGPTAFLTGLAGLWARIEYQSKLLAPWAHLSSADAAPASHTLLADYISLSFPFALLRSLRNRAFIVSITVMVSIIMKILIILSSSLCSATLVHVTESSYPLVLRDKFVNRTNWIKGTGNLAWFIVDGVTSHNLSLPDGISSKYAFPTLQTDIPATVSEIKMITNALRNSLLCQTVSLQPTSSNLYRWPNQAPQVSLNFALSSPDCNMSQVEVSMLMEGKIDELIFARFQPVQCDGVSGHESKSRRILALSGRVSGGLNVTTPIMKKSAQLLCTPTYSIHTVEIIRSSTQVKSITPAEGSSNETLASVSAWDIMYASTAIVTEQDNMVSTKYGTREFNVSSVPVDVDTHMRTAIKYTMPKEATNLFDNNTLEHIVQDYYALIGAIIAKRSLMQRTLQTSTGISKRMATRLVIRLSTARSMVVLLATGTLLVAAAILFVPADGRLLHSNTNCLFNLIFLLRHSSELMRRLRCAGASDDDHLSLWLSKYKFSSGMYRTIDSCKEQFQITLDGTSGGHQDQQDQNEWATFPQTQAKSKYLNILHPAVRSLVCVTMMGLIIGLEVLLSRSELHGGLGSVPIDSGLYIEYTWTLLPALVLGGLSIIFSDTDFAIRTLTPYIALRSSVSREKFAKLDLLDMTIPVAVHRELKLRIPWAIAATAAALFSSLFATLSSSVFQELAVPDHTPLVLPITKSFPLTAPFAGAAGEIMGQISSLIFQSNLSYPRFTYKDLSFLPCAPVSRLSLPKHINSSSESPLSISATVPAVKARMDCRSYDASQIHLNFTFDYSLDGDGGPFAFDWGPSEDSQSEDGVPNETTLQVFIPQENCPSKTNRVIASLSIYDGLTYFGSGSYVRGFACSEYLYIWGLIDFSSAATANGVHYIEAMACNTTLNLIDVNATFSTVDLDLDMQNPPLPLENTARPLNLLKTDEYQYLLWTDLYYWMSTPGFSSNFLDAFFTTLIASPWGVPLTSLGQPSSTVNVTAAIKNHHSIILAQYIAQIFKPVNETETISMGEDGIHSSYNATMTTQRRVVAQDATSTHLLVAFLVVSLVLYLLSWIICPRTDVLACSPTRIASAAALIAGGNLVAKSSREREEESLGDIADEFEHPDSHFWLGWGNLPDEEGSRMGGENEAGVSQFGIFVIGREKIT